MCGICGAVQIGGEPRPVLPAGTLDRMTDLLTHRGPNDRGTYEEKGVGLGVRRLSIIDVDGGHQPFSNEDAAVWAIQNGELYNHDGIREELTRAGHRFESRCDTEILPHLYEHDGDEFARRLRGKFALAVWDGRRRRAVLVRDRLGIKPLYYAQSSEIVVFASELKSLLASGLVGADLDYEAIDAFLALGFFPGPRTPLAGVRKLMPGHRLVIDDAGPRAERYWNFPAPAPDSRRTLDEHAERLLEELDEAVRLRLMSDVPLGAMLSGGLDSSIVVALMSKHTSGAVKTFAVGFAEDGKDNELADARFVAEQFGTDHHELELSVHGTGIELEDLVWCLDEPLADLSSLGFLALSELASRYVTVALSGQGADELLGGYDKHKAAYLASGWARLPRPVRAVSSAAALRGPERLRRLGETFVAGDPATRLLAMSGRVDADLRKRLVRGPLGELDGGAARRAINAHLNGLSDDPLPTTLFLDAQLALVDQMLHYFDRASMAHSLEVRVPFLDHELVEYCATIPGRYKVGRLVTKRVLKQAARGIVPDRVVDKRKIGFFATSVDGWFKAQTNAVVRDYLLAPSPRYAEFLERDTVRGLIAPQAENGAGGHGRLLLAILMLEVWLTTYLPRALGPVEPLRETIALR